MSQNANTSQAAMQPKSQRLSGRRRLRASVGQLPSTWLCLRTSIQAAQAVAAVIQTVLTSSRGWIGSGSRGWSSADSRYTSQLTAGMPMLAAIARRKSSEVQGDAVKPAPV